MVTKETLARTTLDLYTYIVKLILLFFTANIVLTKAGHSTDQHFLLVPEDSSVHAEEREGTATTRTTASVFLQSQTTIKPTEMDHISASYEK